MGGHEYRAFESLHLPLVATQNQWNILKRGTHMHIKNQSTYWFIILTALIVSMLFNGYFPLAVSLDNMTQSAPSKMALATSATSARVGRAFHIMLPNICKMLCVIFPCVILTKFLQKRPWKCTCIFYEAINIHWHGTNMACLVQTNIHPICVQASAGHGRQ